MWGVEPIDKAAGLKRNMRMAKACDAGIGCTIGSSGSAHMIGCLKAFRKPAFVAYLDSQWRIKNFKRIEGG